MSRAAPFSPRVVLAMVAVGAAAFLLFLYSVGAGWTGSGNRAAGSGHAASKGLNGYAALADLLARRGYDVSLSRNPGRLDEQALLVLTPPHYTDGEALAGLIENRRYQGPTIVILPMWFGFDPGILGIDDAPRGWVSLGDAESPEWPDELELGELDVRIGKAAAWHAAGRSGKLAAPAETQSLAAEDFRLVAGEGNGRALAAFHDDDGDYPALEALAATAGGARVVTPEVLVVTRVEALPPAARDNAELVVEESEEEDFATWPLVIVAEPDLVNNYGLGDSVRARMAVELVAATMDGQDLPIVFDLTLPGLGRSENLLTLAFEPPFLAVTLMLLLAALAVGWRAFARFGPPVAEVPALASGKAQLARDGATLVARARRLRLVGAPYAALVAARLGKALGLPERADADARAGAIARALARRGEDPDGFADAAAKLERAQKPADLLRAARALKTIERTLTQ